MKNTKYKKVAIIEVKPNSNNYIAKEMAGGLGKKIKLGNTYLASVLEYFLKDSFNSPPLILAKVAGVCNQYSCDIEFYYTSNTLDIENKDIFIVLSSMADYRNEIRFLSDLNKRFPQKKIMGISPRTKIMKIIYRLKIIKILQKIIKLLIFR